MTGSGVPLIISDTGNRANPERHEEILDPQLDAAETARSGGTDLAQLTGRVDRAVRTGEPDVVFSACVDMFIAWDAERRSERTELLSRSRAALTAAQTAFLQAHLDDGLSAATPTPEAPLSVLTAGLVGDVPLVVSGRAGPSIRSPDANASVSGSAPQAPTRPRRRMVVAVIGAVGILAVIVVSVVVLLGGGNRSDDVAAGPSISADAATLGMSGRRASTESSVPATTAAPTTTAPSSSTTLPDADVPQSLEAVADRNQPRVDELVGSWVPQIDSKRVGMQIAGRTWTIELIQANYRSFEERFPDALLIRSDDYAGFAPGYWVVVIPEAFDNPDDALAWCVSHEFDRANCYAQLITGDDPVGPTAVFLPD